MVVSCAGFGEGIFALFFRVTICFCVIGEGVVAVEVEVVVAIAIVVLASVGVDVAVDVAISGVVVAKVLVAVDETLLFEPDPVDCPEPPPCAVGLVKFCKMLSQLLLLAAASA